LVFEEFGEFAEKHFHKLLSRHRSAIGVPEGGRQHVLDSASFSIGKLHLDLLSARLGFGSRPGRSRRARHAGIWGQWLGFRLNWLAVPLRIAEVVMRFYEIINGKVILAVKEPRPATEDYRAAHSPRCGLARSDIRPDAAALDHAPARRFQRGINVLGAC